MTKNKVEPIINSPEIQNDAPPSGGKELTPNIADNDTGARIESNCYFEMMGDLESVYLRSDDTSFHILWLKLGHERGWAVIGDQSGAIAVGDDNKLLMRMTMDDAQRMARLLSEPISSTKEPDVPEDHV